MRLLNSRPAIAAYTLAIAAAFVGGVAYASIPAPGGVIDACYATKSPHTLRVIDSTTTCPTGTTALNWNAAGPPGAGGVNGIKEFTASGSWIAPAGITHVMVEAWGAGGGGSGEVNSCNGGANKAGGSGGGGGYIRTVISVTAGQTYTTAVGAGGSPGVSVGGSSGGNTTVALSGTSLAVANGGGGGGAGTPTTFGAGGTGGQPLAGSIIRAGANGQSGSGGCGLLGGDSFVGTVDWNAKGGTAGGEPGLNLPSAGTNGYMLLTW